MKPSTLILAAIFALSAAAQGSAMEMLSDYRWKHRIVLVFGRDGDDKLAQQVEMLTRDPRSLSDRELLVLKVSGDDINEIGRSSGVALPADADRLRSESGVDDRGFHVLLIGKDGGVKLRRDDVVDPEEILSLIDSMPMRRSEQQGK